VRLDRRPLLETSVDAELFVDRAAELDRMLRAIDLGLNVALDGPVGSGRTSVLRHLVFRLRAADRPVVFVGASGADSPEALVSRVHRRVAGDEAAALAVHGGLDADALVGRLARALPEQGTRPVLVVDDVGVEPGRALFGVLRDEVWRAPASWVVSAEGDAAALLRPPVDAFFEASVQLAPMQPADLAELLRRRLALDPADVDRLAAWADGSPRRAVDLARAVVLDGRSVSSVEAELADRRERLARVSEPAATLADLVEQLGPVSPSEVDLQRRMGVSRPRLVALFGELRDAGLVVELPPDRSVGTPGRPRTRYALAGGATDRAGAAAKTVGPVRDREPR
jgi:hypothetical protein